LSFIDKLSSPKDDTDLHYDSSREMARGVSWAVLMRWCMRCIGLASTLILARLLSPDDFGVAAMGTLLVGFVGTFTDVGVTQHLIRAREIDRAHCDTAWTIGFLQSVFISIALVALAYPAAAYFGEPRVVNVIYVLALAVFIGGFCSIGLVLARRELNFALDFRFQIYKKLLIFGATVGAALYLRSYWALVLGYLAGTITSVVLSYVMHPYRPAWSLAKMREYLSFGLYVMPLRLGNVLHKMAPKFIVGGLGSASTLGAFTVSNGLASTFTAEIVVPMGRGLFPNYARLAGDKPGLSAVYRQILALVSLVVIPIGTGMSAVASDAVAVVLGPKWTSAVALIEYLAIGAAIYAVSHTMNNQILVATGRERSAAVLSWLRLGITVPMLLLGVHHGGVLGLAQATIVAPLVCLPLIYLETRRAVILPLSALAGLLWRPVVSALVMYVAIKALHPQGLQWAALRLACDVAVGAAAYTGTTLVLWLTSGRPDGAERIVINLLRRRLRSFRIASTA
jgi:lipopolysaccharide exporter